MPAVPATAEAADQLTAVLGELIAFPTVSRSPNLGLIRRVAELLEASGARTIVLESGERDRANLLATIGPAEPGGLMLSGHTDVVPAGDGWATDPFAMTKIGDALHGRGTADMKGFLAAVIRMTGKLGGAELARPVHIVLSFDEEVGCLGVRHALEVIAAHDDLRPDVVVIGEPTMMRPRHSHTGKLAYEVVCRATAAHSSLSHSTPSAITAATRILAVLDDLQQQHRPAAEPEVTFNCGTIAGGTAINVIADRCAFNFETRYTVDHDPDVVLQSMMDAVDRQRAVLADVGGSIELTEVIRYPALRTPSDDPWLGVIERIADAGPATSIGFGTEGGLFAAALGVPVVICGPGDIAVAHRPDEYVTIEQLLRCERFLCRLVEQICADHAAPRVAEG